MEPTLKTRVSALLCVGVAAWHAAAGQLPADLVKKLSARIHELCPEAQIEITNGVFTAKQGTMTFTVHRMSKTGEIYPQTDQEEGPNFKGFMLSVSFQDGTYQGAAMVPQTLQGPYFPTFIDAAPTEDGHHYYWITFSYGSRLDPRVRAGIFEVLPKSRFKEAVPGSENSNPPRSDTNAASSAAGSGR